MTALPKSSYLYGRHQAISCHSIRKGQGGPVESEKKRGKKRGKDDAARCQKIALIQHHLLSFGRVSRGKERKKKGKIGRDARASTMSLTLLFLKKGRSRRRGGGKKAPSRSDNVFVCCLLLISGTGRRGGEGKEKKKKGGRCPSVGWRPARFFSGSRERPKREEREK